VVDPLFGSIFLTILQIFSHEVTLIRDQVLINVVAYDPKYWLLRSYCFASFCL